MKVCKRCGEQKNESQFGKNKRSSDGLWCYCKQCDAQRVAEFRKANPDKVYAAQAKYRELNKSLIAERKKSYRIRNSEECKSSRRSAYLRNRDVELARSAEYKAANKERLSKKAAQRLKENPHLNRFYRSERRAAEKNARPAWYDKEKIKSLYEEAVRLKIATGIDWHVDHVVPLKSKIVCGLHWHGNMQLLPASENQSKSNRHWPDMP